MAVNVEEAASVSIAGSMPGSMPIVSVLLPVYNASVFLRTAIQSILAQTFREFELIVIDDASTDESASILNELSDPRIIRINFEKNRGIVEALNTALTKVRGKYIARMDADDIAHPERFRQQVDYLDWHPKTVLVGTWILGFGNVRRPYLHRYPVSNEEILSSFLFESPFAHPSVMFRREAVEKLVEPYSPHFPYVEDWELWTRLLQLGDGANIPVPLLQYRIHAKSSSQRFTEIQEESKKKLLKKIYGEMGMPFREMFVLGMPPSDSRWLGECFLYYKELLKLAEGNAHINASALAGVLHRQLISRARQMASFGLMSAWFIFRHGFIAVPISQKILVALKVFAVSNARALIHLWRSL